LSSTLKIPADVIADVREGLFCLMGDATQELDRALTQPDRELYPEWFADDRRRIESVFSMLDVIGWSAGEEPRDADVELCRYGETLTEALEGYLPLLEAQEREAEVNDRWRAEQGLRPRKREIAERLTRVGKFAALVQRRLGEKGD